MTGSSFTAFHSLNKGANSGIRDRWGLVDVLRHGDDGFLDHFMGLLLSEACLHRHPEDEVGVGIEELLPSLLVFPILQSGDEAVPGGNQLLGNRVRRGHHHWWSEKARSGFVRIMQQIQQPPILAGR